MPICSELTRLVLMAILIFLYFLVELIVGYAANSIALVADSFHMLSDLISIIVGIAAIRVSKWPRSSKNTFGWQRAEVMGSMVNNVALVTLCLTITFESIERLFKKEPVTDAKLIFYIGIVGLLINLFGLIILGSHSHSHGHEHSHDEPIEIELPVTENEIAEKFSQDDLFLAASTNNREVNGDLKHEFCHLVQCKSMISKKKTKRNPLL